MHKSFIRLGIVAAAALAAGAAHAQGTVKIGLVQSFSGQFADTGAQIENGIKIGRAHV